MVNTHSDVARRKARRVSTRLADMRETLDYQAASLERDGTPVDVAQILRLCASLAEAAIDHAETCARGEP